MSDDYLSARSVFGSCGYVSEELASDSCAHLFNKPYSNGYFDCSGLIFELACFLKNNNNNKARVVTELCIEIHTDLHFCFSIGHIYKTETPIPSSPTLEI